MKCTTLNPAVREGKLISLAPYSFDDALWKVLKAEPQAKERTKKSPRRKSGKNSRRVSDATK
jgi:hypothetical protein